MDEFNKIKELSDDIIGRKEPSFEKGFLENNNEEFPFKNVDRTDLELDDLVEKKSFFSKWGLISLCVFSSVLLIGTILSVVFISDDGPEEIITISPTPTPVRIEPENPGGAIIPDVDKQIYGRMNANTSVNKVEKLFPEPEKPVLPEILIKQNSSQEEFIPMENVKGLQSLTDINTQSAPIIILEEKQTTPKKEVLNLPVAQKKTSATKKIIKKEDKKDQWRVQLVSSSKKASAEKAWADISKKHKALLSDMSHDIVSATISGKGTFYRLQVGQFATRDMAVSLCSKLKARKQECVPVQVAK